MDEQRQIDWINRMNEELNADRDGKPYIRPFLDAWLKPLPKPTPDMVRQWRAEGLIDQDTAERMAQNIEAEQAGDPQPWQRGGEDS